jgi:hypothetical protein
VTCKRVRARSTRLRGSLKNRIQRWADALEVLGSSTMPEIHLLLLIASEVLQLCYEIVPPVHNGSCVYLSLASQLFRLFYEPLVVGSFRNTFLGLLLVTGTLVLLAVKGRSVYTAAPAPIACTEETIESGSCFSMGPPTLVARIIRLLCHGLVCGSFFAIGRH